MWMDDNFATGDISFLSVIVKCYKPNKSKNNNRVNVWVGNNLLPLDVLFLSIIAKCSKSNKCKSHTSTLFITWCCKNGILFYLEKNWSSQNWSSQTASAGPAVFQFTYNIPHDTHYNSEVV